MSKLLLQNGSGEIKEGYPISKDKIDTCYTPNGETYPLCKGKEGRKECEECNLFEDKTT